MSESLSVNTDGLAQAAQPYHSSADYLRHVVGRFQNDAADYVRAFGDDAAGRAAAQQFGSLLDDVVTGLLSYAEAVDGTGKSVTDMANQYSEADQRNIDAAELLANQTDVPTSGTSVETNGRH
jgi:hypothetical protein